MLDVSCRDLTIAIFSGDAGLQQDNTLDNVPTRAPNPSVTPGTVMITCQLSLERGRMLKSSCDKSRKLRLMHPTVGHA